MRSVVVAVGDELLLGDTVNTNAAWLGGRLAAAGAPVLWSMAVGDDVGAITAAIRRGLAEADAVLLTGGLGPTSDDVTREAVAAAAGTPLVRDPARAEQLRARFAASGRPMPDQVLRQADVPAGATALDNPAGTAPGLLLELDGRLLVALPGPPRELQAVVPAVLARLREHGGAPLLTRTVHTAGRGESAVAEAVEAAVTVPDGVALSYLAGRGVVRVRFTGVDDAVLQALAAQAAAALGPDVWGRDGADLAAVVLGALAGRGATVAVAESLTGGLLTAALTAVPGASAAVRGGLVVYATDTKQELAGVPAAVLSRDGAVSAATAQALADGVRRRLAATYGVGVTGVAGPQEQEGRPVGTVHVAVAGPAVARAAALRLPGGRDQVRAWAVNAALDLLRRAVADLPDVPSAG